MMTLIILHLAPSHLARASSGQSRFSNLPQRVVPMDAYFGVEDDESSQRAVLCRLGIESHRGRPSCLSPGLARASAGKSKIKVNKRFRGRIISKEAREKTSITTTLAETQISNLPSGRAPFGAAASPIHAYSSRFPLLAFPWQRPSHQRPSSHRQYRQRRLSSDLTWQLQTR